MYLEFNLVVLGGMAEYYHHPWRNSNYVLIVCISTRISPVVVDTKTVGPERQVPGFMRFNRQCYLLGHPEIQVPNAMLWSKRTASNPYFILQNNSVGFFTYLRKAAVGFTIHVCPSVCIYQPLLWQVRISVKFGNGGAFMKISLENPTFVTI